MGIAEAKRAQEALKEFDKVVRQGTYAPAFSRVPLYVGLAEKDRAFEWLERAYEERSDLLVYLNVDPRLDKLRSDSRFKDLMKRVGLPQ